MTDLAPLLDPKLVHDIVDTLDFMLKSGVAAFFLMIVGLLHFRGRVVTAEKKVADCEAKLDACEGHRANLESVISRLYYLCKHFAGRRDTGLPALESILGRPSAGFRDVPLGAAAAPDARIQ